MTSIEPAGRYLDVGDIRTFVIEEGDGPPLVLLHGSSAALDAHLTWYRTMPAFARHFRTIAPDLLGFGRTAMMPDGLYRNRLERTLHVIDLLDALGVKGATLVGHSEGGFVAAKIAIERPDLVGRMVIVTSGGTAPAMDDGQDAAWHKASAAAYDYKAQTRDEKTFIASRREMSDLDSTLEAILRANFRLAEETGTIEQFRNLPISEQSMRDYTKLQEEHLFPYLDRIEAPALLIWAADDGTVPVARGEALMRMLPRADLHVFQHARHMVMHDRAHDFARLIIDWCADNT
ncbi:MAG: hypothetical protein CMM46_14680 [Rhodospirillaceae bacterium]|nr:hypothetical protein [Rhodospirillaceae bacterium]|tara:strand:+ start:6531 stop:7400 length:870 start_codon:yes stop_codon:yes gene_type:complete